MGQDLSLPCGLAKLRAHTVAIGSHWDRYLGQMGQILKANALYPSTEVNPKVWTD